MRKPFATKMDMKNMSKCINVTAVLVAALSLVVAQPCTAATITVASTADDGSAGTLRAALASAADGDIINITATGTIYLDPDIDSGGGALVVDKSVMIAGPGRDQLTVDGQDATQVFSISSIETMPTVTISSLTIANGKNDASTGGGVYNKGALTLMDCKLSGCYALQGGGGVISYGPLRITRCTLSDNTTVAQEEPYYGGGAIAFLAVGSNLTLTIEDSLLIDNTAPFGGGIALYAAGDAGHPAHPTVTITNSTLSGNSAVSHGLGGGIAIFVESYEVLTAASATVTVENSTLSSNSAAGAFWASSGGGAIANVTYGGDATLTIKNSTLNGNSSSNYGGAVFNNGTVNFVNSTLNGNSGFGGGAVLTLGALTLTDCALNGNAAAHMGGAIMSGLLDAGLDTTLTITRCTLSNNTVATNGFGGGAIMNLGVGVTASLTVADSTLSANSAPGGGAILTAAAVYYGEFEWEPEFPGNSTVNIKNSTLSGNSAQNGGGIANWKERLDCSATLTVNNSTLSGNRADDTLAGAIFNGGDVVGIKNTILAAGPTGANLWNIGDFGGTIASSGYNLSSDDGGGFLTATGDRINTDPKLGALADNGGPTWTCALLAGSPAIDTGNSTDIDGNPVATDQRGVARPQGSGYDIGAFELHPATSPMDMKTGVLGEMRTLRATLTGKDDQKRLDCAIASLSSSLKPGYWIDANHVQGKYGKTVFAAEQKTVQTLTEIRNAKKPPSKIPAALLQDWMSRLVLADRTLAVTAVDAATAAGGNTRLLCDAKKHLADGDAKDAHGYHADAIAQYSQAWESAVKAQSLKP
jgi:hypothetical protein